jgi:dihydrofolate reductase
MLISLIFAVDEDNAIGFDNRLPWHLPADLKHFKSITMGHFIIMGRRTAESIGKALPGRTNIAVTSNSEFNRAGILPAPSLSAALRMARDAGENEAFIIGGATLFKEAMPLASKYYLTVIHHIFGADTYLPAIDWKEWNILSESTHAPDEKNKYSYTFFELERKLFTN